MEIKNLDRAKTLVSLINTLERDQKKILDAEFKKAEISIVINGINLEKTYEVVGPLKSYLFSQFILHRISLLKKLYSELKTL